MSSSSTIATNESCSSSTCCSTQNIRVVTRIRPLSTKEINENSKESVIALEKTKMIQVAKNKDFAFDAVFGPNTTQREVYEQTAGDMIRSNLFKGFNVTVLACKLLFIFNSIFVLLRFLPFSSNFLTRSNIVQFNSYRWSNWKWKNAYDIWRKWQYGYEHIK
jgi:hypothetical protein